MHPMFLFFVVLFEFFLPISSRHLHFPAEYDPEGPRKQQFVLLINMPSFLLAIRRN